MINDNSIKLKGRQFDHHNEFVVRLEENDPIVKSWFSNDTTDYWRHKRMRDFFTPMFSEIINNNKSVLTVGDGRFGTDAIYLKSIGLNTVVASDLQCSSLDYSKRRGLIDNYLTLDLEKMNLDDNTYNYIFCKESLHHLPKPYLGLYEMLRVASNGVLLIEPAGIQPKTFFGTLLLAVLRLFRKRSIFFEESGNYVFELRIAEIEQFCLANGIKRFSYKFFNDHYIEGSEFDKKGVLYRKIRLSIFAKNLRDFVLGRNKSMIALIIHDNSENNECIVSLKSSGFITWSFPG